MGDPGELQRVVVVGTSCAGKSTFSSKLAILLECPRIELDALYWGPDWRAKPAAEFRGLALEATSGGRWIADGNYGSIRDLLWSRATAVIWLDYSFPRVFWRALKRTITRCLSGQPLWHGNRESFRKAFLSRDSILLWVISTHRRRRRELAALRQNGAYPQLRWIEFRHPREAERWLGDVHTGGPAAGPVSGASARQQGRRGGCAGQAGP